MNVLVVNAGSSTLKYQVIDTKSHKVSAKGSCERVCFTGGTFTHAANGSKKVTENIEFPDHKVAIEVVLKDLEANGVKIEAIGSGKKIRGRRHKQWRPDLIVCDDLENDENVNTPEQRKKLRDWFYKAVSKAGDTYTDIVYIGTLLHFDALLANVAKNPSYKSVRYQGVISFATNGELWDAWESIFTDLSNDNRQEDALEFFQANREAMLEGTAVLWEEKLSYYDLMVIRISEGEASFNSEIQNDPIDPENCTFQEEWFDFWDDEGKAQPDFSDPKFLFVGANDPSLGKNKVGYTRRDYEGKVSTLCAGCGHDSISAAIIQACWELNIEPHRVAKLSGIGCSSKTPDYFLGASHGFNSVHGRMPSVLTGASLANRDLLYLGISGDGDSASIGLGQFVNSMRRTSACTMIGSATLSLA